MKKIGLKNEFAIWYTFDSLTYNDDEYETDGRVYFWVKNKNLFQIAGYGPDGTYEFDLSILVDFFCRSLFYHITEDPFPVSTMSTNAFDMVEEVTLLKDNDLSKLHEIDWDNIDMEERDKIYLWNYRHGTLTNNGGSCLPDAYIRKVNDKIEISWNNKYPHENKNGKFYHEHKKGLEYIDLKLYRDTVAEFCLDFINQFESKYPCNIKEYKVGLKKAIDVAL